MKLKTTTIIFLVLLIALCLVFGELYILKDRTAPVISISEDKIIYNGKEDKLLKGVTAVDDKDGDVTKNIIVESVLPNAEKNTVIVRYIVKDSSNNVATEIRIVECVKDFFPEITEPEQGDEQTTEITPEPAKGAQLPVLTVSSSKVTVKVGDDIDIRNFVEKVSDDVDDEEYLYKHIAIEGDYDLDKTGRYNIVFVLIDSSGNKSTGTPLEIIVEEQKKSSSSE